MAVRRSRVRDTERDAVPRAGRWILGNEFVFAGGQDRGAALNFEGGGGPKDPGGLAGAERENPAAVGDIRVENDGHALERTEDSKGLVASSC